MSQYTNICLSKKDQVARTPSSLIELARDLFVPSDKHESAFFDPCPYGWTETNEWNALDTDQPWRQYNFINPPFNKTSKFIERAISQENQCVSVFLIPCRFHTRYFANALPHIRRVVVISNRVKFVGYKTGLQAPVCFVVFGPEAMIRNVSETFLPPCTKRVGFRILKGSPTLNDVASDASRIIYSGLSDTLNQLLNTNETKNVLCPARLDNRQIQRAVARPNTNLIFVCPTLRVSNNSKAKFPEGSVFLNLNAENQHDEINEYIDMSFLPTLQITHSEHTYLQLLTHPTTII
jgi:hypothetical protein